MKSAMTSSIIEVLTAILPVIGMIAVGVFLKKTQWISRKGIDDIKFLVSRIMLTVAVFHADLYQESGRLFLRFHHKFRVYDNNDNSLRNLCVYL